MSLYLGDRDGIGGTILRTTEPVGWAGWGTRPFTHFVLLDSSSSTFSQYWWSTGSIGSANSLTGLIGSGGAAGVLGGTGAAELYSSPATTPNYGGGLRLYVVRGDGFEGSNTKLDYQAVQGFKPYDNSEVVLRKSGISSITTGGANALGAKYLSVGYASRYVYGSLYALGSLNRAISDEEIAQILTGDIQILDYFKHNLVELWDFQRSDESALIGLISGTQFDFNQRSSNMGWTTDSPLPVSRTRGKTILGATNRSALVPVWAYNTASTDNLINISPAGLSLNSSVLSPLQEHSIEPRNLSLSSNPLNALSKVDILHGSVELTSSDITLSQQVLLTPGLLGLTGNNINLAQQGLLNPGSVDLNNNNIILSRQVLITTGTYTFTGNDVAAQLYINITGGSVVAHGNPNLIGTNYPNIEISILPSVFDLVGNPFLIETSIPINPGILSILSNPVSSGASIFVGSGIISSQGYPLSIQSIPDNLIDISPGILSSIGYDLMVSTGIPFDHGRKITILNRKNVLKIKDIQKLEIY